MLGRVAPRDSVLLSVTQCYPQLHGAPEVQVPGGGGQHLRLQGEAEGARGSEAGEVTGVLRGDPAPGASQVGTQRSRGHFNLDTPGPEAAPSPRGGSADSQPRPPDPRPRRMEAGLDGTSRGRDPRPRPRTRPQLSPSPWPCIRIRRKLRRPD